MFSLLDVTHRPDRSSPLQMGTREDRLVTIGRTIAMHTEQPIQDQHDTADVVPASATSFAPFARQRTVLLTTFRRDGTAVKTPVNIAVDGDRAFIRSWDSAGKVKRIRNNPEVAIAPCTARGRPTGPPITARARILSGQESARAGRLLARKHPILQVQGLLVPLGHRLRGNTTTHIELTR
jgi:PPOX class probable F420-dependent enzyme